MGAIALAALILAGCGGGGGSSAPAPLPPAPTGLTATPKDGYVLLDANPPASGVTVTGYNIYWSTAAGVNKTTVNKIAVGSTPQAHTGLANGTKYYYVATAINANGESAESTEVSATPVAVTASADPLFVDQWNLKNTGQSGATPVAAKVGEDINVQPVWLAATPRKGSGGPINVMAGYVCAGRRSGRIEQYIAIFWRCSQSGGGGRQRSGGAAPSKIGRASCRERV